LSDRDDPWGEHAADEIRRGRRALLALYFTVRQQCHLRQYSVDYAKMDQVTKHFQGRSGIDPDKDLEALVPTAGAIRAILAGHAPCKCISTAVWRVVDAMEAVRSLHPRHRVTDEPEMIDGPIEQTR
jgi:hypothetical protein